MYYIYNHLRNRIYYIYVQPPVEQDLCMTFITTYGKGFMYYIFNHLWNRIYVLYLQPPVEQDLLQLQPPVE
jgi:hypothetical protein